MTHDPPMTVLVARRVQAANRPAFEAAMRDITEAALAYPGHLGVSIFRPAAGEDDYRILFRFDRRSQLDAWRADAATQALFPLVSLLLTVLQPALQRAPFLLGTLLVTGLVTLLMTYVVMPRLTRLLRLWLFPVT